MIGSPYPQQYIAVCCTQCNLTHSIPVGVGYTCGNCGKLVTYGWTYQNVPVAPYLNTAQLTDHEVERICSGVEYRVANSINSSFVGPLCSYFDTKLAGHSLTEAEVERIACALQEKIRVSLMLQMGVLNEAIRSDRRDSSSAGEGAGPDRGGAEGERKPVLQEQVRGPEVGVGSLPDPPF